MPWGFPPERGEMAKLVECIPNFSCSRERSPEVYEALVKVAEGVPGCTLFDAQTDGDHNRSVFTMIGSPEAIEEVAFQLTKKAAELIDMREHQGAHKRMGATDVIPFVPQMDVTVADCVAMSKRVAKRIWEELQIPCFLYEDSATSPNRKNLATIRKGEFEGMPEKLLQEEWAPDYGERKIHPTAGVTAVGARFPLVAFNMNLATDDVSIAKKIARTIRASSGGFRSCKAMGFKLEDRGMTQVSVNMVNYEDTPLWLVYETVKTLAERWGTHIVESELVGLTPAKALADTAEYYFNIKDFDCKKQVIEYHLIDLAQGLQPKVKEPELSDLTVRSFADLVASDAPAPGGGSVAALYGAIGSALTAMVAGLTQGRKKYAAFAENAFAVQAKCMDLKERFLDVMHRDTLAFNVVSKAYGMPRDTDEEKAVRRSAIQEGLKGCTKTPLEMMELCEEAIAFTRSLLSVGFNETSASDLGVSVLSFQSAVQGAWLNVLINLGSLKDEAFVAEYKAKGQGILERVLKEAADLYGEITTKIEG